jgi:hypothetical protein
MRQLVTFILRLWVDPETSPRSCEGQVECLATGEQSHVRSQAETAQFIETCLNRTRSPRIPLEDPKSHREPD